MKKFFRTIANAGFYFSIYYVTQTVVVSGGMILVLFAGIFSEVMKNPSILDHEEQYTALIEILEAEFMSQATLLLAISLILALFFLWLSFALRKRSLLRETECGKLGLLPCLYSFLLGISACCLVQTAFSLIPFPESWMDSYVQSSSDLVDAPLWVVTLASVILAPIVEEVVFRGLVYTRLRRVMPIWVAMLVVSLLFGVLHGNLIWFIYTFLLGLLIAAMFERTGSLLSPILIHFGFNFSGTYLGYLVGEEISVPEMVLLAVVGVIGTVGLGILLWGKGPGKLPAAKTPAEGLPAACAYSPVPGVVLGGPKEASDEANPQSGE